MQDGKSLTHLKYLHYFGNEASESLLEAHGIIMKDKNLVNVLKLKQCPNCSESIPLPVSFTTTVIDLLSSSLFIIMDIVPSASLVNLIELLIKLDKI